MQPVCTVGYTMSYNFQDDREDVWKKHTSTISSFLIVQQVVAYPTLLSDSFLEFLQTVFSKRPRETQFLRWLCSRWQWSRLCSRTGATAIAPSAFLDSAKSTPAWEFSPW